MIKLCLYTEELYPPFDEGYKNFTYNLFRIASQDCEALRIGSGDPDVIDIQIKPSKFLNNRSLRKIIRDFHPDVLIYVPTASATTASFIRTRVLGWHGKNTPVVMIGLQPREYPIIFRPLIRMLAPSKLYVQSRKTAKALAKLNIRVGTVSAGVDTEVFKPPSLEQKNKLRVKYGLDSSKFILLHVGHINEKRNVHILGDLANIEGIQVVLVGSSSTSQDQHLAEKLRQNGVIIFSGCVEHIEELYQLADVYIFPVIEPTAAVEMPLSVLEAMSCDLPIITTRFGGLPDCFNEGNGFYYVDRTEQFKEKVELARHEANINTREKIAQFTWPAVIGNLFCDIESLINIKK